MLDRLVEIVIWWTLWGTAGIALARHRGGNSLTWFFVCGFTGPVGLAVGLLTLGTRCPHCRSLMSAEATVCPKCQSEIRKADKRGEESNFPTGIEDAPIPPQAADREEANYAAALEELDSGSFVRGVWAKAFADSSGDEGKARALYLRRRVQLLEEGARKSGVVPLRWMVTGFRPQGHVDVIFRS